MNHGTSAPKLRILAAMILGLTCSSSACERNWSVFDQVHTKRCSRMLHDKMSDLVSIKFNSKLKDKKLNKRKDPIEKQVVDVLEDDENEWITGVVPNGDEEQGEDQDQEIPYASSHAGPGTSAINPLKRKRGVYGKKKKKMIPVTPQKDLLSASSASESDDDEDTDMSSGSDM